MSEEQERKIHPRGFYTAKVINEQEKFGHFRRFEVETEHGKLILMRKVEPYPVVGMEVDIHVMHRMWTDEKMYEYTVLIHDAYQRVADATGVERSMVKRIAHLLGYQG